MTGLDRLDRTAEQIGLELERSGKRRSFSLGDREIIYRPRGKGTFAVEAKVHGEVVAIVTATEDRIERLFLKAVRS